MAVTNYQPTNWNDGEPVYTKKLRTMANNDQWLFENMPRMRYNAHDVVRTEGIKIAAGLKPFVPTQNEQYIEPVEFGAFFSSACYPVVVVGGLISRVNIQAHTGARAFAGLQIDHRGFEAIVNVDPKETHPYMRAPFYLPWIAVGF